MYTLCAHSRLLCGANEKHPLSFVRNMLLIVGRPPTRVVKVWLQQGIVPLR